MVVADGPDARIAAVLGAQNQRISRAQLEAVGSTAAMIKTRVARGQLCRIFRGVYGAGPPRAVELGDETAALLAAGEHGALGLESAAFLWEIRPAAPAHVDVVVPVPVQPRSRPGVRVHRSASITRADVVLHRGLPVTSPAWTLRDLADSLDGRPLERALDEALHRNLVNPTKIREVVARTPGRRGGNALLELLEPGRGHGITRSQAEERMLGILRDAGVADAERNARIGRYEVDFLWRKARVVVEVDSYTWHSGPAAFKRDREKDMYLREHGLEVIRVTWEMMDRPLLLVARIVEAIALRQARRTGAGRW